MDFFTSPQDLKGWVRIQQSPDFAATKILEIIGKEEEQDIVDTCRQIYKKEDENNADNASQVLFGVLAKHNLAQIKEGTSMNNKLIKEAQMMRGESPLYQAMPMRVCPKLPFSQGKRLISTYNCRHYCLDSLVFDDDPIRVYCAEALWRRHVMDKFSREFKDKDGKFVGGYINSRFQVFHDNGGNQMELANEERTRKPRPHQYSTERRLSEGRGEETYDLTASSHQMIKLAAVAEKDEVKDETQNTVYRIFDDIVDMKEAGFSDEDILYKTAEHYGKSIPDVALIYKLAMKQVQTHNGLIYSYDSSKMKKEAQAVLPEHSTMVTKRDVQVTNVADGRGITLRMETPVVMVSNDVNRSIFEVVDGPDAGQKVSIPQGVNASDVFGIIEDAAGKIQDAAQEVGLNEGTTKGQTSGQADYPIVDKTPIK